VVATVVGVLVKKKTRYRSVVVRCGAAPIAEFKKKKS
jgi:hypothetical protein